MKITFTLNGENKSIDTDGTRRLLDVLREDFDLKGAKEGCSEGECGACSVMLNDHLVTSCIIPVAAVEGQDLRTIEWVRTTPLGKILIQSFADGGAVQCGFCIPGMVMAGYYLLINNPSPRRMDIRKAISGNMCRCTGYDLIAESILLAAKRAREANIVGSDYKFAKC